MQSPFADKKILAHLPVLNAYVNGGWYAPIQVEIDLTNACTSNCPWCAGFKDRINSKVALFGDPHSEASKQRIVALLDELKVLGVKSVVWTGGGDPTVHPRHADMIQYASVIGLDVALITNGVMSVASSVQYLTWLRFSVDAGTESTYERQHGRRGHFERVLRHVSQAVEAKKAGSSRCTIGVGFVASEDVRDDIEPFVKLWTDVDVDYIQFRPRMDTMDAKWGDSSRAVWEEVRRVAAMDGRVVSSDAKVRGIEAGVSGRTPLCHGTFLETAIAADGHVYACCHLKGDSRYSIGDLNTSSFEEVWRRHLGVRRFQTTSDCPAFCRHYGTNAFVSDEVLKPRTHENFI